MALTPLLPTARANENPDLGPSTGIGFARESAARSNQAGSAITQAGLSATNKAVDILNKKQAQDDNLNGFNFGVEYNTRAAQILHEEQQIAESDISLTDRVRERLQTDLELYSESKNMNPNTRVQFNKRAAMTDARVNSAAAISQLAEASVKRNFAFRASLDILSNQLTSGNNLQAGFDEYNNTGELIKDPLSNFNAETQTILTKESSKLVIAAANGLLQSANPRPDHLIDELLRKEGNQFDDKITNSQKRTLLNKAKQVKASLTQGIKATQNNIARGQIAKLRSSDSGMDPKSFSKVFPDHPERQLLHEKQLAITAKVRDLKDFIGEKALPESLKSLETLKSDFLKGDDDVAVHTQNEIILFEKEIAAFQKNLDARPLETSLMNKVFSERYYKAFKDGNVEELKNVAMEAQVRHGIHPNDVKYFTNEFVDDTLSTLRAPLKSLSIGVEGNIVPMDEANVVREQALALQTHLGTKMYSQLIKSMRADGADREIPSGFYQALTQADNETAFAYSLMAAKLTPERLANLVPKKADQDDLAKAITNSPELAAYLDSQVGLQGQAVVTEILSKTAYVIRHNTGKKPDEIVKSLIDIYLTKNNLGVMTINRKFFKTATESSALVTPGSTDTQRKAYSDNMSSWRSLDRFNIDKKGTGQSGLDDAQFLSQFVNQASAVPTGNNDGTYHLVYPSDRGKMFYRDSGEQPIVVTEKELLEYPYSKTDSPLEKALLEINGRSDLFAAAYFPMTIASAYANALEAGLDVTGKWLETLPGNTSDLINNHFGPEKDLILNPGKAVAPRVKQNLAKLLALQELDTLPKIAMGITKGVVSLGEGIKEGAKQGRESKAKGDLGFSQRDPEGTSEALSEIEDSKPSNVINKLEDIAGTSTTVLSETYGWTDDKSARVKDLVGRFAVLAQVKKEMTGPLWGGMGKELETEFTDLAKQISKELHHKKRMDEKPSEETDQVKRFKRLDTEYRTSVRDLQRVRGLLKKEGRTPEEIDKTPLVRQLFKAHLALETQIDNIAKETPLLHKRLRLELGKK
jgi:hypothetical protein